MIEHFTETVDGMSLMASEFSFTDCIDLLRLIEMQSLQGVSVNEDFWSVLLAVFHQKANSKDFFLGQQHGPTPADCKLLLHLTQHVKIQDD